MLWHFAAGGFYFRLWGMGLNLRFRVLEFGLGVICDVLCLLTCRC